MKTNQVAECAKNVYESNVQTMTSLQIADLAGKNHKDVMRAIRNMEPAWVKINGRNFALVDYIDAKGEMRPCYELTKTECLYIATKFNDEARAKLVLRWEELELEKLQNKTLQAIPSNPGLAYVQTQLYLADALSDRLRLNDASRLGMYQSIAAPYNLALPQYVESKGVTKSAKELLKDIGSPMSAIKFNMLLVEKGYLETMTRPSSGGAVKKFKNITEKGKPYGENIKSPRNQKETQPHWYVNKFRELYKLVVA